MLVLNNLLFILIPMKIPSLSVLFYFSGAYKHNIIELFHFSSFRQLYAKTH